jgi:hypothetical protein
LIKDIYRLILSHLMESKNNKMKKSKNEEIQYSVENYLKQRNFVLKYTQQAEIMDNIENFDSLGILALNDLSLIESSISDYYDYSFSSQSDVDYLKQFERFVLL